MRNLFQSFLFIASSFADHSLQQHQIFSQYQKKAEEIVEKMTLEEKIGL